MLKEAVSHYLRILYLIMRGQYSDNPDDVGLELMVNHDEYVMIGRGCNGKITAFFLAQRYVECVCNGGCLHNDDEDDSNAPIG